MSERVPIPQRKISITAESSRDWLDRNFPKLERYLKRNHKRKDWPTVFKLLYDSYPDEGKKLVENFDKSQQKKKELLVKFLVHTPQITCILLGDQRKGKDATLCKIFEDIREYCKLNELSSPRIVTLGNLQKPPFVAEEDMYFSFMKIPFGTSSQPVYIYASELEAFFPARDFQSPENKLFSNLEGTMAQNHQKLFGCVKLTSKVDISVLRSCNCKIFKFISPEKLNIEGIERHNVLSDLGYWLLPSDPNKHSLTLLSFDNNLLTVDYDLPSFWTQGYSEQFKGNTISKEKVLDYVQVQYSGEKNPEKQIYNIQTVIYNKFRRLLTKEDILSCF